MLVPRDELVDGDRRRPARDPYRHRPQQLEVADVRQRVADRGQLPVEHSRHLIADEREVAGFRVAVHQRDPRARLGLLAPKLLQEPLDGRQRPPLNTTHFAFPAIELAVEERVTISERVQPGSGQIDKVDRSQLGDHALAHTPQPSGFSLGPDGSQTQRLGPLRERTRHDRQQRVVGEVVARVGRHRHRDGEPLLGGDPLELVVPLSELAPVGGCAEEIEMREPDRSSAPSPTATAAAGWGHPYRPARPWCGTTARPCPPMTFG
jgi:hypothetical protein